MKSRIKVIDSLWTFLVATAFLGPFALPLLWRNPRWSAQRKVAGTLAVLLFTALLVYLVKVVFKDLMADLESATQ